MFKVSIIMCAYNVALYIEEAIQSILNQSYQNWELLIYNDASTDDTAALVQPHLADPRIRLFNQAYNVGYIRNKNQAFRQASGALLTQLDADDVCPPNRLALQVAVFEQHPEIMICGSNYQLIDLEGRVKRKSTYKADRMIYLNDDSYPFWFPGLMFRKTVISEFGLFSEYFNGIFGDDQHWTMRVNQKYPIYFISKVLYHYRVNPTSLTNVFDNKRKLIVEDILAELKRQRITTGTDWLEEGAEDKLRLFEAQLFANRRLMSEKYRIWSAKAIDKKAWRQAKRLLLQSFVAFPVNAVLWRTTFYYLKKRVNK